MTNPLVSVILTNYNHSKYVAEAIESVLMQSFKNFELLIIDDVSSDNSCQVIQNYKDKRIKFIKNKTNLGQCRTTNLGISLAQGKYVTHICSDDRFSTVDKLQKQVDFLENPKNSSYGAVFTLANPITENGEKLLDISNPHYDIFDKAKNRTSYDWLRFFFFEFNCLCFPSIMLRKECYKALGVFDSRYTLMLDLDMWIRLVLKYDIHVIQEKLIDFRVGESSNSSKRDAPMIAGFECGNIMQNFLEIDNFALIEKIFKINKKELESELVIKIKDESVLNSKEFCNFVFLMLSLRKETVPHANFFLKYFFENLAKQDFCKMLDSINFDKPSFYKIRNKLLERVVVSGLSMTSADGESFVAIANISHFAKILKKKSLFYKITHPLRTLKRYYIKKEIKKYERKFK